MAARLIQKSLPFLTATAGLVLLYFLATEGPGLSLEERLPGTDRPPGSAQSAETAVELVGTLEKGEGVPAGFPGSWPRFRGPNFDNINREKVKLARKWGPEGPPRLWDLEVGEGYAGAAIHKGRVYLIDYDRAKQADVIRCLSAADGREIWRYWYPVKIKRNHGMSRTVPAVTDKYVVTMGPKCHVTCLDAVTGEHKWALDLVREWKSKVPQWYAGQCPLIDGDRAIIAPGGDALMLALDCKTGKVIWKTPNPRRWRMTHSSIIPMMFKGKGMKEKKMYIYCGSGGVAGVSAEDGALLWDTKEWKISIATVPSPVPVGDDRIFLTGGYNAGSLMLKLTERNGKIRATSLFRLKPQEFACIQQTPILYENHLFGVKYNGQLACCTLEGKVVWTSGAAHKFGLGPFMIADGLILVMNDKGKLTLAEASTDSYRQLTEARVLEGHDSWGPFALAGGRLIARDLTHMVCLAVRAK